MSHELPHYRNPSLPILLSLTVALMFGWLPWSGLALALRPDLTALVVLYWATHTPHRMTIALAWAIGLLADVADASLLGQHALAYSALALGGIVLRRRILMLDLSQQTMQVFPLLLANYLIFSFIHWLVLGHLAWSYMAGCLSTAVLWVPLTVLLQMLSRPRAPRQDKL